MRLREGRPWGSRTSSRGGTHRSGLPVSAARGLDKRKQAADWREQNRFQSKHVREAERCSDRTATKKCAFTDTHVEYFFISQSDYLFIITVQLLDFTFCTRHCNSISKGQSS